MKIRVAPPARAELRGIVRKVTSDHGPAIADRVAFQVTAALRQLERFPELGKPGRIAGTRELGVAGLPFIVVYQVGPDVVTVLRILHGAMQWPPDR